MSLQKLTIGADPELAIVSPVTGKYSSAQRLIAEGGTSSEFGLDGNPSTCELRPHYATNPLALAENIYKILEEAKTKYPQVFRMNLRASDAELSIGGHIHFVPPHMFAYTSGAFRLGNGGTDRFSLGS